MIIVMHFIRVFYFSLLCLYIVQLLLVDSLIIRTWFSYSSSTASCLFVITLSYCNLPLST